MAKQKDILSDEEKRDDAKRRLQKQAAEFAVPPGTEPSGEFRNSRPIERGSSARSSIVQQLDMNESGPMRGDEILHSHGRVGGNLDHAIEDEEQMNSNYRVDMSESGREGDEMSGDDHSAGLQGGESELETQPTARGGLPGEEADRQDQEAEIRERRRLA